MVANIRAVYEDGHLRLLDPVDLKEGEQVRLSIEGVHELDVLRAVLGNRVRWANPDIDPDSWVENEAEMIDKIFQGTPSLSQIIIEDRGDM